jgi:deltex-like protein
LLVQLPRRKSGNCGLSDYQRISIIVCSPEYLTCGKYAWCPCYDRLQPDYFECPLCETLQGVKTGNQPTNGSMVVGRSHQPLPGFPGHGRITITYNFGRGTQDGEGPHPGRPFIAPNFPKVAFLPDNEEGNKVLELFQEAWNRRLLFQIVDRQGCDTVTFGPVTQKIHDYQHVSHRFPYAFRPVPLTNHGMKIFFIPCIIFYSCSTTALVTRTILT